MTIQILKILAAKGGGIDASRRPFRDPHAMNGLEPHGFLKTRAVHERYPCDPKNDYFFVLNRRSSNLAYLQIITVAVGRQGIKVDGHAT